MKTLFKTTFGSHLYGTNTEQSDTDYKAIYLPELKDIILGRVPVTSLTYSTGSDNGKNTNNDVDTEIFTLRGFFRMLQEGQMVALDMLFSPEQFWIEHTNTWINILQNKDKILNKNIHGYIGYINKQCAKYGIKGSRISELREVIAFSKYSANPFVLDDFRKCVWSMVT
jgi:predicted nucleotidyltransferase